MIPFQIGNWIIDTDKISHISFPHHRISINKLTEAGPGTRSDMYDWLVHLPQKKGITAEDVYSLNTALVYALEHFGIDFPRNLSFVKTFIEQQNIIKNELDEN